ncbi:MAG: hypothetical protein DRJ64_07305 [Thermoprotei archaeon]|nr:MAG: hypothetical protein DRJ64_07305 [Thermoprotei archaeon]
MLKTNLVKVHDCRDNTLINSFKTNCPPTDLKIISNLVKDAQVNLFSGNEMVVFTDIITALGYTMEDNDSEVIEITL